MSNLKTLVKSIFLNSFRGEGKKGKGKTNGLLGMLISGGIFALLFAGISIFLGPSFNNAGLQAEFLTMIFLASQIIVLIFGTVIMVNIMFFSKDAELMLYLPIKPATIFLAKIIYVYLTELVLSAFMVAVTGISFGIICGFSAFYYMLLLLALFIVPMVPLILSALFTLPIMYLLSFLKNKSILSTIVMIVVFGTFMYFYMGFFAGFSNVDESNINLPIDAIKQTMSYMIPNISLARIVTLSSGNYLTDILYILISTVGIFGIALLISSFAFKRGMASQLEETRSTSHGKIKYEQKSALKSILIKEAKELIRNPGLAFYCLFQIIMAPIMISFYGTIGVSADGGEVIEQSIYTGMGFFFIILMVIGINYTALSAISREGANFNMSKSLPAPYMFQIRAKMILSDIVLAAGLLLSFLTMILILHANLIDCVLFAGFGLILGNAFNNLLIYFDAKNPKLDWESITVALKNSKASLISVGVSMAVGLPFLISYILINEVFTASTAVIATVIFWVFFYAVAITMNIIFRKLLNNNIERLIANCEN